jgi:hypothetical protein
MHMQRKDKSMAAIEAGAPMGRRDADLAAALASQQARDNRWAYLLEGIRSPRQRSLVSQLLDNQVQAGLYEDDTTVDIPTFTTLALAFIPKVYPSLLIGEIASVQPMPGPTARVFFEDFVQDMDGTTSYTHGETANIKVLEGQAVAKARYKLTGQTVTAQKYALQVQWTTELAEDLRSQYGQDLQSRVFDYVARELIGNIDSTALATILAGIGPAVTWSATAAAGWSPRDWSQTHYGALVDASLGVENKRFRHPDYIVCSPVFAARLEKLETFKAVGWPVGRDDEPAPSGVAGVNVFGSISGRWSVYRSPWIGDGPNGLGQALVGIKGEGFIYAPYVPVQLGPILPMPGTDEMARVMRTRAGMALTAPSAFGMVTVTT